MRTVGGPQGELRGETRWVVDSALRRFGEDVMFFALDASAGPSVGNIVTRTGVGQVVIEDGLVKSFRLTPWRAVTEVQATIREDQWRIQVGDLVLRCASADELQRLHHTMVVQGV